jgi:hypothetical protein
MVAQAYDVAARLKGLISRDFWSVRAGHSIDRLDLTASASSPVHIGSRQDGLENSPTRPASRHHDRIARQDLTWAGWPGGQWRPCR